MPSGNGRTCSQSAAVAQTRSIASLALTVSAIVIQVGVESALAVANRPASWVMSASRLETDLFLS